MMNTGSQLGLDGRYVRTPEERVTLAEQSAPETKGLQAASLQRCSPAVGVIPSSEAWHTQAITAQHHRSTGEAPSVTATPSRPSLSGAEETSRVPLSGAKSPRQGS